LSERRNTDEPDFAALSGRIYRLCLALLRREDAAADAAQEALTRAWLRRGRKRRGVVWWTWTAGFAVRVCREVIRERRFEGRDPPDDLKTASHALGDTASNSRSDPDLQAAIHALPNRQREVTVLRFLVGQSIREVAATLDCPEGTVKSNLFKAVRTLRGRFDVSESGR
jgi:RNA polymerase sigma-70 factor (ECF subfamily)